MSCQWWSFGWDTLYLAGISRDPDCSILRAIYTRLARFYRQMADAGGEELIEEASIYMGRRNHEAGEAPSRAWEGGPREDPRR